MYRKLKSDKDAYITNKFVDGVRAVSGNTGIAGSLDLFKLYGITLTASGSTRIPESELSRILIHFDLNELIDLYNQKIIDIDDESFKCYLSLKDVYGGQPTPNNFSVEVFPLSSSFNEGYGRDTAYFADIDKCNFISSSADSAWFVSGCAGACFATSSGDYITSSLLLPTTKVSQFFKTGEEDLFVDVTNIISATLVGDLPDEGFRISFSSEIEDSKKTYFVKRFASRSAYDETKHPKLIFKFDDSIQDDTSNLYVDAASNLFLYNYIASQPQNIFSASLEVTGSNCLLLEMKTYVSGVGEYSLFFTGSQHSIGNNFVTGIYSAPVTIPSSNSNIRTNLQQSGSVAFTPIWSSLDKSLSYLTGSVIKAYPATRGSRRIDPKQYAVYIVGLNSDYSFEDEISVRVNMFDQSNPIIKAQRLPIEIPGVVVRNSYFAVRNVATNEYEIPFDPAHLSTRLSSDANGMYCRFKVTPLTPGNSYVIDVMIEADGIQQKYLDTSSVFRIKA